MIQYLLIMLETAEQPFQAQWNPLLHPNHGHPLVALIKRIRDYVFYLPNRLFAFLFNPASSVDFSPYYYQKVDSRHFSKQIFTPDHIGISAQVFLLKKDAPLIILFNPLGAPIDFYEEFSYLLGFKGFSSISFTYRNNSKMMNGQDFVIDGDAVYQYAVKELKIDPSRVHFYGHSLGGAIAAQVKAVNLESTGKYVGDRPFKSIFSVITDTLSNHELGIVVEKISYIVVSLLLAYPFTALGWEWNVDHALAIAKGEKKILYHPKDNFFSYESSAASCRPINEVVHLTNDDAYPHGLMISNCSVKNESAASYVAAFFQG